MRSPRTWWRDLRARRLLPESRVVVTFDDEFIVVRDGDEVGPPITWKDLTRVTILTTDEGPLRPDVYWLIEASTHGSSFPGGATGELEVVRRLQDLPGFDHDAVIAAMGSTSNRSFVCWERSDAV